MSKMESFRSAAIKSKEAIGKGARATWEGAKVAKDKIKDAKDTVADSAIYKKVSGAAKNWKDDMVETIKLKTVDKWKMMAGRGAENWLLNRKNSDIDRVDGKIANSESSVSLKQEDFKREEESINAAMAKISDPKFKEIFENGKAGKKAEMDREIEDIRNGQLKKLMERKAILMAQKERYEANIKNIESKFTKRIDDKIEKIRSDNGYAEKMEQKKTLDDKIGNFKNKLAEKEKGLVDCEVALANKSFLTKADQKRIKERAAEIKKSVEMCRKVVERAEKAREKNEREIGKIDRKTLRWETMKTKYGLNKGEKVATEEGADKKGAEDAPAAESESKEKTEDIKTTTPTEEQKKETKSKEDFFRGGGYKVEGEDDKEFNEAYYNAEAFAKAGNYDDALAIAKKTEKSQGVLFLHIAEVAVENNDLRNAFRVVGESGKHKEVITDYINRLLDEKDQKGPSESMEDGAREEVLENEEKQEQESKEDQEKKERIVILKKIAALCDAYQNDFQLENKYKGIVETSKELKKDDPLRKFIEEGRPKDLKLGMITIGNLAKAHLKELAE